jgi:hypothetical protein
MRAVKDQTSRRWRAGKVIELQAYRAAKAKAVTERTELNEILTSGLLNVGGTIVSVMTYSTRS